MWKSTLPTSALELPAAGALTPNHLHHLLPFCSYAPATGTGVTVHPPSLPVGQGTPPAMHPPSHGAASQTVSGLTAGNRIIGLHVYKPANKNEVRLVYRVPNGSRHQRSYSCRQLGHDGAWQQAMEALSYIRSTGRLPARRAVKGGVTKTGTAEPSATHSPIGGGGVASSGSGTTDLHGNSQASGGGQNAPVMMLSLTTSGSEVSSTAPSSSGCCSVDCNLDAPHVFQLPFLDSDGFTQVHDCAEGLVASHLNVSVALEIEGLPIFDSEGSPLGPPNALPPSTGTPVHCSHSWSEDAAQPANTESPALIVRDHGLPSTSAAPEMVPKHTNSMAKPADEPESTVQMSEGRSVAVQASLAPTNEAPAAERTHDLIWAVDRNESRDRPLWSHKSLMTEGKRLNIDVCLTKAPHAKDTSKSREPDSPPPAEAGKSLIGGKGPPLSSLGNGESSAMPSRNFSDEPMVDAEH